MIKGINDKEEKIIKHILSDYPYRFYYYGSRVKGDFTKASDLDILIRHNEEIPERIIDELQLRFNESLIPYVVNFSDFSRMDKEFFKLIEPDLVPVNPTP